MSNTFKYFKFLCRSTNAHGVHSPFVYDLVTQCFYDKNKPVLRKDFQVKKIPKVALETLNFLPKYLKSKTATFNTSAGHFIFDLPNFKSLNTETAEGKDLIYVAPENFNITLVQQQLQNLKEAGVLIVERPHDKPQLWEQTKRLKKARVVVDTYYFGLLFPKNTQAREEFKIRL